MSITNYIATTDTLETIGIGVTITAKSNSIFSLLIPPFFWFGGYFFGAYVVGRGIGSFMRKYIDGVYAGYTFKEYFYDMDVKLTGFGLLTMAIYYKRLQGYL